MLALERGKVEQAHRPKQLCCPKPVRASNGADKGRAELLSSDPASRSCGGLEEDIREFV